MNRIESLQEGNEKYVRGVFSGNIGEDVRTEAARNGQKPYAVVVTCADSRVVPEFIFSVGIGELFTVRTAGNVATPAVLGSVEYAVDHLGVEAVIVLGHTNCGAVAATKNAPGYGYTDLLIEEIRQAIGLTTDERAASILNARASAANIREKLDLPRKNVLCVPALYDVETGNVLFL